jgi:hypothetical protein
MTARFTALFKGEDWKRVFAWIVVYGYWYNIVWPWIFWGTTVGTLATGVQWPAPPLVPWEQLVAMTANLAVIGTVQLFKDKRRDAAD